MVRLALIGCEQPARYAAVAGRLREGAFTAVVDPDPERARNVAQQLGASIWTVELGDLLARHAEAFDAVLIHSAVSARETHSRSAIDAGKHVFVKAPVALSTEGADALIEACRAAEVRLMVGETQRFLPAVQAIKESLDAAKLGEPGLLRIHRWGSFEIADCRLQIADLRT